MRKICSILLAVLSLNACKKKEPIPEPPVEDGNASTTIVSTIPDSVFISMSGNDIVTGTIPHIFSLTLAAGDSIVIPRTDLKSAYRYYYEWNTKDYKYSSWYHTDAQGRPTSLYFDYYSDTTNYKLNITGTPRNELKVFLDNDGTSSSWIATDAFDENGISIWNTLTDSAKNHRFQISRFHTVKHTFTEKVPKERSYTLSFTLPKEPNNISMLIQQSVDSFILTQNAAPTISLSTTADDTLYYLRKENGVYIAPFYKIARVSVSR